MKMVNGSISDIHEANLNFLISAKKLAAEDKNEAAKQFGLTEDTAAILECLSLLQVVHLAATNALLSQVSFDDRVIGQILTGKKIHHQIDHFADTFVPANHFPWLSLSTDND
jgi:Flagellar transcriptional activator (FlhD)